MVAVTTTQRDLILRIGLAVAGLAILGMTALVLLVRFTHLPATQGPRDRTKDLRVLYDALLEYRRSHQGARPHTLVDLLKAKDISWNDGIDTRPYIHREDGWEVLYDRYAEGQERLITYRKPPVAAWVTSDGDIFLARTCGRFTLWPRYRTPPGRY